MKKLLSILAIILLAASCGKEDDDATKSRTYVLDKVYESSASINEDDTYLLEFTLHGQGFYVSIGIKSPNTEIPEGIHLISEEITAGGCKVGLNDGQSDKEVTSGSVNIAKNESGYSVTVDLMSRTIGYIFEYHGPVNFNTSIEPSENTVFITEGNATRFDMNTWQDVIVSGVSKYTITVMDPSDKTLASIELINTPGKTIKDLTGEYSIQSGATSSGTAVAGAVSWGNGSGSFYYDDSGNQLYITGGKIKLSSTADDKGVHYYSISGSGLGTLALTGATGSGSLKMKHMKETAFNGTVIRNVKVRSTAMGMDMKYSIYLPSGYNERDDFPVLYLLHGYGDENNAWLDKGLLVNAAYSHEKKGSQQMIVVCPDGLTTFYYDSPQTKFKTYFFDELVPEIEKTYKVRTDRESRAVAGLSMGGYGTLYYGLAFPDLFCYAYACSAAIDIFNEGMPSLYDLAATAEPSSLPGMTIEMGTEDYTTGNGENFHNTLESLGIKHEYIARSGSHDWKFWQECLPKVLNRCAEAFKD